MAFATQSSGEKLYLSYNGKAGILGNNYIDSITGWSGVNLLSVFPITFKQDDELWLMGMNGMAVVKNKKVVKQFKAEWANCWFTPARRSKGVLIADFIHFQISYFDGSKVTPRLQLPLSHRDSLLKKTGSPFLNYFVPDDKQNIWFFVSSGSGICLYRYDEDKNSFDSTACYSLPPGFMKFYPLAIRDEKNFAMQTIDRKKTLVCADGKLKTTGILYNTLDNQENGGNTGTNNLTAVYTVAQQLREGYSLLYSPDNIYTQSNIPILSIEKKISPYAGYDSTTNSYFLGTENKPVRAFPYIQKYPRLYNGSHSNSTFSLSQDEQGNIWAGSYYGAATIIDKDKNKVTPLPHINFMVMNGALHFNKKNYLIGEGISGLHEVTATSKQKTANDLHTGFYLYQSPVTKKIYYGKPANLGLWATDADALERNKPDWHKTDSSNGLTLHNILTITEDKRGRIWCGHPGRGIAVYDPGTDKAHTWLTDRNESTFGAMSSLTDKWGTVWLGSKGKGLWYYNDYTKDANPANCKQISHPLLNDPSKTIMSMCTWYGKENYLVLGCYDKICLLNLDSFYQRKKILVRYLNPQEASFSSFTEQNTMFLSNTDSTIWFSTSDMVYNWDINKWLSLPVFNVQPQLRLTVVKDSTYQVEENRTLYLSPTHNSISAELRLLSPDLLPRFLNVCLVKKGDSLHFPAEPGLENKFRFSNLSSGHYILYVRIFQADGSVSIHQFPIVIKKFIYQHWWFWLAISVLVISSIAYLLNLKRKKQVADQQAKTKEAELQSFKNEQEKKMANLRLLSLSSQFRPHFILNALNTIGAQMEDKPETETVLSRLGESVNIIFNHATQQKTMHSFSHEWKLVTNIIDIHRLMYLKQLHVSLPAADLLEAAASVQVPMGILQIPVENALLHGLSNRDAAPWELSIAVVNGTDGVRITITDNGVGRKRSATLSNHTKHGTGTKNLTEIIGIINAANTEKITVDYTDQVFTDAVPAYGTAVHIYIPSAIKYDD